MTSKERSIRKLALKVTSACFTKRLVLIPQQAREPCVYFRVLGAALGLSEHLAARVRCDAAKMADAMRRATNAYDRLREMVPLTPRDPHIDLLRALVDRVEDLYEMAVVGGSLAARSREAIPRPQGHSGQ